MLVNLNVIMERFVNRAGAVAAFNVFGYEDAISVVQAAEEVQAPVILATNKIALEHMPVELLGPLLCSMGERASVPVCVHLDHGLDLQTIIKAILSGYTSVMYDGSQLSLDENIRTTKEVVKFAHAAGIPVEAEIGSVGYSDPAMNMKALLTDPEEARIFAEETEVDALAVAVGSLHRMQEQSAVIQFERLEQIQSALKTPLVIHGSTGITDADMTRLAAFNVTKVNVGTALRMAFGQALRQEMKDKPDEFDRIRLFQAPMLRVKEEAMKKMLLLLPQ